jgi:hypothetical protein
LWIVHGNDLSILYQEVRLAADNPKQCPALDPNVNGAISALIVSPDAATAAVSSPSLSIASQPGDHQIKVTLINGMVIETSDSIGNVEVRAKSVGPGFCGSRFSGPTGNIEILAPPFTWSNWITLYSHIGKAKNTINYEAVCDTGIEAEIRYFTDQ